ncbi:MAG: hypothetical protein QM737_12895 [Ferruginibacter sp.]
MKKKIKRKLLRKSITKSGLKFYYELSETEYVIYAGKTGEKSKLKSKGHFWFVLKDLLFSLSRFAVILKSLL